MIAIDGADLLMVSGWWSLILSSEYIHSFVIWIIFRRINYVLEYGRFLKMFYFPLPVSFYEQEDLSLFINIQICTSSLSY